MEIAPRSRAEIVRRSRGDHHSSRVQVKADLASKAPYGQWLAEHATVVDKRPFTSADTELPANMVTEFTAFGWSSEDLDMQIADMGDGAKETLFSMGDDAPLAVLSTKPRPLYDYFKQRFAQVGRTPSCLHDVATPAWRVRVLVSSEPR